MPEGILHHIFRSTLNLAAHPLRHFLRKCHLPLPRRARQEEVLAQTILTHRTRAGWIARAGSGLFLLLNIQADAALDELGGFFHALAAREIACGFLGDEIEHVLIVVNKGRRNTFVLKCQIIPPYLHLRWICFSTRGRFT